MKHVSLKKQMLKKWSIFYKKKLWEKKIQGPVVQKPINLIQD